MVLGPEECSCHAAPGLPALAGRFWKVMARSTKENPSLVFVS